MTFEISGSHSGSMCCHTVQSGRSLPKFQGASCLHHQGTIPIVRRPGRPQSQSGNDGKKEKSACSRNQAKVFWPIASQFINRAIPDSLKSDCLLQM